MKKYFTKCIYLVFIVLLPSSAFAVRPFVTDDARIADYGQLEFEVWSEFNRNAHGQKANAQHAMAGITISNWLQIITGGGIGRDIHGNTTTTDLVFQPKFLIKESKADGTPGIALLTGIKIPTGKGELSDDATGAFLVGVFTSRLLDDLLLLHVNAGIKSVFRNGERKDNFHWGVGVDIGIIHEEFRYIAEVYAGDHFETVSTKIAYQTGFRYLHSDYLNFDITFGAAPESLHTRRIGGDNHYHVQFGVRMLFDAFTDSSKLCRTWGACGMFP